MSGNKRLCIFRDKICTHQKYTQKVKWKRSTELLRPKISRLTEKMTLLGLTMGEQQSAIDLLWSNLKPGVAVHKPGTRSAH
jgi:hypothetical protein